MFFSVFLFFSFCFHLLPFLILFWISLIFMLSFIYFVLFIIFIFHLFCYFDYPKPETWNQEPRTLHLESGTVNRHSEPGTNETGPGSTWPNPETEPRNIWPGTGNIGPESWIRNITGKHGTGNRKHVTNTRRKKPGNQYPEHWTWYPEPRTCDRNQTPEKISPEPGNMWPEPETRKAELVTLNSEPFFAVTRNTEPGNMGPIPGNRALKTWDWNLVPATLNPETLAWNAKH